MASGLWLDHAANGEAFSAENFVIAVVGLFPLLQIRNPPGSGVRVRLRHVHTIGAGVSGGAMRRHDPQLATTVLPATFIIENLLPGGPAAVAEMNSDLNVAALGAIWWQINSPANFPASYPPEGREWGFDLLEGQGILVQGSVGTTVIANWMWAEVPL